MERMYTAYILFMKINIDNFLMKLIYLHIHYVE